MNQQSIFIIAREDLLVDPVTIAAEGILIGRLPKCELLLNHPSVSRLHAGITNAAGDFYIRNLRPINPILLNGKPVEEYQALTDGDVLGIGPFALNIDFKDEALVIKVSLQIAAAASDAETRREASGVWDFSTTVNMDLPSSPGEAQPPEGLPRKAPRKSTPAVVSYMALDVFWSKRITSATKTVKPSPLFPTTGRASGKAQSFWKATSDLKRRWPVSMLWWGVIVVGLLSVAGALFYAAAFAPGPIAEVHTRAKLSLSPPIANRPNAGSCTSCHGFRPGMEARCSSCHATDAFVATVIEPHMKAGIGCLGCHGEHRGAEFSAVDGALLACAECHNDNNKRVYNGKKVSTPHGGTFGYPVVDGHWKWPGLDKEEMALRKASLRLERQPTDTEDQWRSKQFHAVHIYRVRAVAGLTANKQGELTCSTCHKSFSPLDITTPRTTCANCHNGQYDPRAGRQVIAADKPNCTSCHVQHVKDQRHWNPGLLTQ